MTLPAFDVESSPQATVVSSVTLEQRLENLQQDYAELNTAIFEAAQVHRRLCAPSLVRYGGFDVASEIFAVRHLPGDFFSVEETNEGLILAVGDIVAKVWRQGCGSHILLAWFAHTPRRAAIRK